MADPVDKRTGFAQMLQHLATNGAKTIIVESPISLRQVSRELATRGYLNKRGKPCAAKSVASMLN
jgi:hypothetical protein